ncbi:MAG: gliding motility-associated ABC transporter substrate-binding protein GldG [Bacteroidales bacterium]|jgi:ABC-2 type transport system permease protein|nr:gliding motility-associated ABC transporter substrate-binding protein GldG [Bacteroidales bacterium]
MFVLFKKELSSFLSSLTGYVTVVVFLAINGLFLWIVNTDFNIFDFGLANLDGLFIVSPWVFLFLIPAITMKMFAEEKKSGTIELLLTKPLSDMSIVFAKFMAAIVLVALAILPTLLYIISIYQLGMPKGNLDLGAIAGSYIGLMLLSVAFVAIGLYISSLTESSVVAFVASVFVSALIYIGFDLLCSLKIFGGAELFVRSLGINQHYASISRGVIDSRDIIYYASLAFLFLFLTKMRLENGRIFKAKSLKRSIKNSHILQGLFGLVAIIFVNVVGYYFFGRLDLTQEKRYSLSKSSKDLVKSLKDVVFIRCYLEGDMSANYRILRNETREMINQLRSYNSNIEYEFFDPNSFSTKEEQNDFYKRLLDTGFKPLMDRRIKSNTEVKQYIFPYIEITYGGRTGLFSLISSKDGFGEESIISNSTSNLEYNLYIALRNMANPIRKKVAFLNGHGEWDVPYIWDFAQTLGEYYSVDTITINEKLNALTERRYDTASHIAAPKKMTNKFDCLIIAKPTRIFSYKDLYIIDQFVMHGGKILWLLDPLTASIDTMQSVGETYAVTNFTGVEDPLFRYGVRLQTNLIMDMQCCKIPIRTGEYSNGQPQYTYFPWNFFPEISPNANSIITDRINPVKMQFASVVDTIENNIKKTPILFTSDYTRLMNTPVVVSLQMLKEKQDATLFTQSHLPVAMLLEGDFNSAFAHRLAPEMERNEEIAFKDKSDSNAMIVVGDGDIVRNDFMNGQMLPLGYDKYTGQMYGNKEFLINCVNYLCGDKNIIPLRSREVIMRKLEMAKLEREKTFWQVINVAAPVLLIVIFGIIINLIRRKRYVH